MVTFLKCSISPGNFHGYNERNDPVRCSNKSYNVLCGSTVNTYQHSLISDATMRTCRRDYGSHIFDHANEPHFEILVGFNASVALAMDNPKQTLEEVLLLVLVVAKCSCYDFQPNLSCLCVGADRFVLRRNALRRAQAKQ